MTSQVTQHIAGQLRERAGLLGISRKKASEAAGIAQTMGNNIFLGRRAATTDQLEALCKVLKLEFEDVIGKAAAETRGSDTGSGHSDPESPEPPPWGVERRQWHETRRDMQRILDVPTTIGGQHQPPSEDQAAGPTQ